MSRYVLHEEFVNTVETSTDIHVKDFLVKSSEIQDWMKKYPFRGSWTMVNRNEARGTTYEIPPELYKLMFLFENERDAFDFKLRFT